MELKDTTAQSNAESDLSEAFLLRLASPTGRYGISLEQLDPKRYQASVFHQDPAWGVDGVLRYWRHTDRADAEARVLLLQGRLAALDEALPLEELLAQLPEEDPGDWPQARMSGGPEVGETAL